jgi:hypothetical protein
MKLKPCPFYANPAIGENCNCCYLNGRRCEDISICPHNSDAWCITMINKGLESAHQWNNRDDVELEPNRFMTIDEYEEMDIQGWHEVRRNHDDFGTIEVRFLPPATGGGHNEVNKHI